VQLLGRIIGQPAFQVLRVFPWVQTPATGERAPSATLSMHISTHSFHGCHENSDFARELCHWESHTVCTKRKLKAQQLCVKYSTLQKKKHHGLSPRANYTDRATAASRRSVANLCG
jgi:hypothetical protein